jgi:hypothetical protein
VRLPAAGRTLAAIVIGLAVAAAAAPAAADDATDRARAHYEAGLELFYARDHAQALVEFQRAHEVKPRPATLFMMGQCEYFLGTLTRARKHYQDYLQESPAGEFVEVAKDRIESINRRPATLVINTVPDEVDVRVRAAAAPSGAAPVVTGQAPNEFSIPRGKWVVTVSKANHQSEERTIELEVAETKPLFFKLEPIPARLEVETIPPGATLYVNGNRARNPYRQDVPPGRYELIAEATDHEPRTEEMVLHAGERRLLSRDHALQLNYVQRSGRAELVVASGILGALTGAAAVAAGIGEALENAEVSSVSLLVGGAAVGAVAGTLVANSVVPSYIPDNRALFILGGMWIGAAEGALAGIAVRQASYDPPPGSPDTPPKPSVQLRAGFLGSLPGLAVGITAGGLFSRRAPTYGRVSMIQSAAAGGALVGGLAAIAFGWKPYEWQGVDTSYSVLHLSLPALIGLNVGLGAGLLGAYLPDQSRYGPSWKRIGLIDLAVIAGLLAGGVGA